MTEVRLDEGATRPLSRVEITVSRSESRSIEELGAFGVSMETRICIARPKDPDRYGYDGIIGLTMEEARMVHARLGDILAEFPK